MAFSSDFFDFPTLLLYLHFGAAKSLVESATWAQPTFATILHDDTGKVQWRLSFSPLFGGLWKNNDVNLIFKCMCIHIPAFFDQENDAVHSGDELMMKQCYIMVVK